ncbi:histone-lysine N-methyltransferase SETMAR [Trichonephila clavipes]|nr:histone-lysine N-methyltransferase SETMAR [Trichonephila clavipes]
MELRARNLVPLKKWRVKRLIHDKYSDSQCPLVGVMWNLCAASRGPLCPSGQGIGSWLACHEFEPSTTQDPPRRGAMHVKSVESSNVLPVVWCDRRGRCQFRYRPRHLTMVQNDKYEGIVYQHAVEPDTTVNDSYYTNVLRTMVQHVKRKRPLLRNGFFLHHHNARPHIVCCVLDVSQQNNVEILPHPPCSPDLTPCDFWLLPQLKKPLRRKRVAGNKACVKAAETVLK